MTEAPSTDCLFCRIVAGDIPATIVERTAATVAFRDISPVSPTHILVIPITHYDNLDEAIAADPGIVADMLGRASAVAAADGLTGGYRVVINTGGDGGQTVNHLHAHVLGGRHHSWPPG
jgi:histidine triad (HIT) family protein